MGGSNELRQNMLTGHWIAVAPNRGRRPLVGSQRAGDDARPDDCPFCPGSERELAPVLLEVKADADPGWRVRVVPNRYPAFTNDAARGEWVDPHLAGAAHAGGGLGLGPDVPVRTVGALPAVGYQEVIIETPEHARDLSDMTTEELACVMDVYHCRYLAVSESAPGCRVFLFRNHGAAAGTSIEHPHAQLIATTAIPPEVRVREIRMLAYHNDHGRCLLCTLPEVEPGWEQRLVGEHEHYRVFVPWAAESECEMWIVPRAHQAEFGATSQVERSALAEVVGDALQRLRDLAGNPPYNLMIHSSRRTRSGSPAFHWFLQIRPRSAQSAGFELASGIRVNASSPERDARILRGEGEWGGEKPSL